MVNPAIIAAGINAGSTILGGLMGGDEGPGFTEQYNNNRRMTAANAQAQISGLVTGANVNGLHPLAVLGQGTPGSQIQYHNKSGPDLAALGQGIDRAMNAGLSSLQRKSLELDLRKKEAEIDYIQSQTTGSQRALSKTGLTPSLPSKGSGDVIDGLHANNVDYLPSDSVSHQKGNAGLEAGRSPMWKVFRLENGRTIKLPPNQSIEELGLPMGIIKGAELITKTYDKYTPGYWMAKKWKKFKNWQKNNRQRYYNR